MQTPDIPRDVRILLKEAEHYLAEGLQNENLSKRAREKRDEILLGFCQIRARYSWESQQRDAEPGSFPLGRDGGEDDRSLSQGTSDDVSLTSDYQDDDFEEVSLRSVQELEKVLKQGYLEKKNRDHGFFGSEWQKRWCVLTNGVFYYYSSEKGKQPKGVFLIKDYAARLASQLRKDSRRDACFELVSSDKRSYQFTAASPAEARDWVDQVQFLLKDITSATIPFEDEETYDDVDGLDAPVPPPPAPEIASGPPEDDIYELLPDEEPFEDSEDLKGTTYQIQSGTDHK
ncbi:src kinase-associated phosphoprotein 1 [Ascaphus truei]|uniref:src kinase-associated phosphoprotein 1 n=1 Tax=Ascaphus truei TaxID=8439 RepID=UPI003F5A707D